MDAPAVTNADAPGAGPEPRRRVDALQDRRAIRALAAIGRRIGSWLQQPLVMLGVVLIGAFAARAIWLDQPGTSLVFDEAYYVNAARILLGWNVAEGAHYAGDTPFLDPNTEHPPLGKLLIAGSMAVFGDNGFGWRIPSLIAGMIALGAMYAIVRTSRETRWLGVLVVGLLAFENLTLVHGRIATLDILVLAPILVGSWLALRERWILAAVAMAIGVLIKITAIYGVGAVLLLYAIQVLPGWWRERRIVWSDLRAPVAFVIIFFSVSLVGLALLDARFTAFTSPADHVRRILEYGSKLQAPVLKGGFCPEADSRPWQWLFNECQIQYLRIDVSVRAGERLVSTLPRVDFRGALNPLLMGVIPLSMIFTAWYAVKTRHPMALWALTWGAANYLPYVLLAFVSGRIMYIYYFLPALPAVAVATALLLMRSGLPRIILVVFVIAYMLGFAAYFPFRQIP